MLLVWGTEVRHISVLLRHFPVRSHFPPTHVVCVLQQYLHTPSHAAGMMPRRSP